MNGNANLNSGWRTCLEYGDIVSLFSPFSHISSLPPLNTFIIVIFIYLFIFLYGYYVMVGCLDGGKRSFCYILRLVLSIHIQ